MNRVLKRTALCVTLAFVGGCVTAPQRNSDEPERLTKWLYVKDANTFCQKKVNRVYAKGRMYGCYEDDGYRCTIWTEEPVGKMQSAAFLAAGHELHHCFKGHFHGDDTAVDSFTSTR